MTALQIFKGLLLALLLLGQASSQSKRNPKLNIKTPARNQKGSHPPIVQPAAAEEVTHQIVPPSGENAGPLARNASVNSKPSNDMKLTFLKNTKVTCNDGTTAGYYIREQRNSKRWIIFLEGGWCCYNTETCDGRHKNTRRLTSSSEWPQTRKGTGILSAHVEENPYWWSANAVFVPYCSSDIWIGTLPKSRQVPYAFMGSLIIQEVIKDLVPKGMKQAKVLLLAGSSAGATGVLLNIDRVAALLEALEAEALQVQGLVDSGWFLVDTKRPRAPGCSDAFACSPVEALKKGIRMWSGILPEKCKQQFKRGEEWQCFLGYKLYSSLKTPVFVVQWLFDEEQLKLENVRLRSTSVLENQWSYIQNLGRDLKSTLHDIPAVFAPSCLAHTLVTKSYWTEIQVKGVPLPRALQCWGRSLQEVGQSSKPPLRSCSFRLIDSCLWPNCNPSCSVLQDRAGHQEA
ncbi:palmitoleoyl-protein carboxylesterase notum2-like [Eublepharis macularius]|uniref:Palmitoleoyl-protein carboxylesterase notum2-like n=1 Tax=Eublepharis macularius TaxID=481883 RepID=A0AA97K4I6_EUBMA|nr:palmitoleoyl-protein carboxylesterase notum2-like [Eublepharis macularius]